MLRPLAFEAVWKQHDKTTRPQPLGLTGGNELVDDRLRAVGEVAELRFPQYQRARVGDRIAIFESKDAKLGQRAVADLEATSFDVAKRNILLAGLLIDPCGVPLAERAASAILSGQAHRIASGDEAPERQRLGRRPVEASTARKHLALGIENPLERAVDLEALGDGGQQ